LESLRQQLKKAAGQPNFSLADFVVPDPTRLTSTTWEQFAVTIKGAKDKINEFAKALDDYNKILVQVLADRFVEAFAECLHEK
jgi:5-methyltetrahydrofolate--homocysteine methyltransferase